MFTTVHTLGRSQLVSALSVYDLEVLYCQRYVGHFNARQLA